MTTPTWILMGHDDGNPVYCPNEPVVWAWLTKSEAAQILATLEAVIAYHSTTGAPGFAEELGDIRDVLNRSGITA